MSKNRKSGKKQTAKNLGDVTINDFANSATLPSRPRKSSSNVVTVLKKLEVEKPWDEKEEFEGDFDVVREEDEEGTVTFVTRKVEPRQRRKTISSSEKTKDSPGNVYPLDIWFLISEYIRPEDVGRFAGICKLSYTVVCSAKFWFSMYRRYINMYKCNHKSVTFLPERLQPESMFRLYGLRASVVRALYFLYPPFKFSLSGPSHHPEILKKRQCSLMWYECQKNQTWQYYFKLKEKVDISLSHSAYSARRHLPDILEMLEDVCANSDEHCKVLEVTCSDFVMLPPVIGLTLSSVSLNLSYGLCHQKLHLGFNTGIVSSGYKGGDGNVEVILDWVVSHRILDWWHPAYPHNYNIPLLNED